MTIKKTGVLIVNLGTPDAPEKGAVKRYLKEFLSDRRVVEIPPIIWQPILRGIILNTRPAKSAAAYSEIWMDQGSPLAIYTQQQAAALSGKFGDDVQVDWAMRYGNPSIVSRMNAMKSDGCKRILVAALYPQYSGATTASAKDAVEASLTALDWKPELRWLEPYYSEQAYIDALANSVTAGLDALDFEPDAIVASFHGIPQRSVDRGDPYAEHCHKTAELLSAKLDKELIIAFQSRFGPAKWLEPATDTVLETLPKQNRKKVAIFAPGFSSDCLETLEELAIRGREQFEAAGGEKFAYLPCLNDSEGGVKMLESLIRRELDGWT